MTISTSMSVAEIARSAPATIRVFQQHRMDFCCGGRIPLGEACMAAGLDPDAVVAELIDATTTATDARDWNAASLSELIQHIQERYHAPLREELPRLSAMMTKVVQRHGDRLPDVLTPLRHTFEELRDSLSAHMSREDVVLFPAIARAEAGGGSGGGWSWIDEPIDVMEAEHADAGAALVKMRELTSGYMPPDDACPTFRGLYYGLAEFERTMHEHVHLENNILFPRALHLVGLA